MHPEVWERGRQAGLHAALRYVQSLVSAEIEAQLVASRNAVHVPDIVSVLDKISNELNTRWWLEEGSRASYTYDDDRYYQEIHYCFEDIRTILDSARTNLLTLPLPFED